MPRNLDDFYATRPEHRPLPPDPRVAEGALRYQRQRGGSPFSISQEKLSRVMADPARGQQIANVYAALPSFDPEAVPAYRAMREETGRQFEFLTGARSKGGLGIDVEVTPEDPYPSPIEMRQDLSEGRIKVLSTKSTGGHPFFSDDENDMFRAVHDVFGHAGTGRGFDRHGEEAAWVKHSEMYSPLARRAMSTETRGQNSAFIFGSGGQEFPEQKVALLPDPFSDIKRSRPLLGQRSKLLNSQQFSIG